MSEATRSRPGRLRLRRESRDARHLAVVGSDSPVMDAGALTGTDLAGVPLPAPRAPEEDLDVSIAVARHPAGRALRQEATSRTWTSVLHPGAAAEDSLTGLVTPAYLCVRLGEVYREATVAGWQAADRYSLVIFDAVGLATDPWEPGARLLEMSAVLRVVWPGSETLAAMGPARVAALVPRTSSLIETAEDAAELVAANIRRASDGHSDPRVVLHVIDLPESLDTARTSVGRLTS